MMALLLNTSRMKRKRWVVLTISPTDTRYDKEAVIVSVRVKSVSQI